MPLAPSPCTHCFAPRWPLLIVFALASYPAIAHADPPAREQPPAIRKIAGKHLTLLTDLPAGQEIDALTGYFDQAFGQWCKYFEIDPAAKSDWHVRGHLMRSRDRFRAAGLLPADLPPFNTGYARGSELWLDEQSSDYYRRHLLLHEGTHAFMHAMLGGVGAPWYAEGVAELLATHRLEHGELTLGVFPRARDEVPKWGRIEIVQTGFAAKKAWSARLFGLDARARQDNDLYGWCWAMAAMLDGHPRYQARFRQLTRQAASPEFSQQVADMLPTDGAQFNEDWQLFVANLDYNYDFARMEIENRPGTPLGEPRQVSVAADRGWQSSGVNVEAGQRYEIVARGRYQLNRDQPAWNCEPGGVTIHYYHGQPLGILLAAVREDSPQSSTAGGLVKPSVVGLQTTLVAPRSGTLYFRINDSAGSLSDNQGQARVEIRKTEK